MGIHPIHAPQICRSSTRRGSPMRRASAEGKGKRHVNRLQFTRRCYSFWALFAKIPNVWGRLVRETLVREPDPTLPTKHVLCKGFRWLFALAA